MLFSDPYYVLFWWITLIILLIELSALINIVHYRLISNVSVASPPQPVKSFSFVFGSRYRAGIRWCWFGLILVNPPLSFTSFHVILPPDSRWHISWHWPLQNYCSVAVLQPIVSVKADCDIGLSFSEGRSEWIGTATPAQMADCLVRRAVPQMVGERMERASGRSFSLWHNLTTNKTVSSGCCYYSLISLT